jgi:ubiquinone/menaquinone biosynthesis C-methylase UbiE
MTPPAPEMPDYHKISAVYDRYLPLIAPVGDALRVRIPQLPSRAIVLDAACGTGEPGLTLARDQNDIQLLGVDSARSMIDIARAKAQAEGLDNARFEVGALETLTGLCADETVDAVISRFGLLLFGDKIASACELARVLKKGGVFSLAVWEKTGNAVLGAVAASLVPRLPEQDVHNRQQ